MGEEVKYGDGMKTHGMKGSVVPKSTARPISENEYEGVEILGQIGGSDDIGGVIDTSQPIPQNIIEYDDLGNLKRSYVLDEKGLQRLKAANTMTAKNPNPRPQSYATAAGVGDSNVLQARTHTVFKRKPTGDEQQAAEETIEALPTPVPTSSSTLQVAPIGASWVDTLSTELAALRATPRVKVRFSGQFGSLAVLYNHVHREDFYLVMIQHSEDGEFYEAPSGDQQVLVEYSDQRYTCFPGPQVRLLPGGKIMVTVYMVEEEPA